ncbi:MAG: septum formation initiator family protein [Defluviitaleaceae bacterium]|nr:septum formation initiator family protein [Defluviitaleaceae bacterium]
MADLTGQGFTFLLTAAAGFVFGFIYDGFRIFRKMLRHNPLLTALEDALFWLFCALLLFALLMHINFGQLRFFTFLGVGLGITLYLCTLSRLIFPLGAKFAVAMRKKAGVAKRGLQSRADSVKMKGTKVARSVCGVMKQKIKHANQRNKVALGIKALIQLLVLIAVVGTALYLAVGLMGRISEANAQIAYIEAQIAQQEERQRELSGEAAYVQSLDFIESAARQHLRLVHRDEIIFVMVDGD